MGNSKEVGIERAPHRYKDIIDRQIIRDSRLSLRALGVAVRLLSNAAGFKMTSLDLARERPEGRDAVRSALRELEKFGYLRRTRTCRKDGRWITVQVISDEPLPAPENPSSVVMHEQPVPENPSSAAEHEQPAPENPSSAAEHEQPAPENPSSAAEHDQPAPENPSSAAEHDQPAPENPSSAAKPEKPAPENPTVGGSGGKSSNISTSKINNNTADALFWPPALTTAQIEIVKKAVDGLDRATQQQLLDELAGAMRSRNPPRHLGGWMFALRSRQNKGGFVPSVGLDVERERIRRAAEAAAQQERNQARVRESDLEARARREAARQKAATEFQQILRGSPNEHPSSVVRS